MKRIDIMRRAGRNLRQAKGRTALTSLAIAVGAFTLTLSLAAGAGARNYAQKLISSNVSAQQVFILKDPKLAEQGVAQSRGLQEYSTDTSTQSGYAMKMLTQSDLDSVARMPHIVQVTPFYSLSTKYIQFQGNDKKYVAQVDSYDEGREYTMAAGTVPSLGVSIGDTEATVPESFATTLGVAPASLIGKKVTITAIKPVGTVDQAKLLQLLAAGDKEGLQALTTPQTFARDVTIRAVIAKGMAIGGGSATNGVTISSKLAREIAELNTKGTDNYQKYFTAIAWVEKGADPEVVKAELKNKGYGAQTAKDAQSILFTIVNILQGIVTFFGILALLASVFGIVNTQYISVLERTSQIGLMKALGMSRRAIAMLFRYEAAWIGFIGGVLGSILAVALGVAINPWINQQLSLGTGNYLLIFVWWQITALLVGLVVIAVVAGWLPARKAARLDPIEALRTE